MDNLEARSLLSAHRAGESVDDARFAEAEQHAAADPDLARWWSAERELDRAIGAKLASIPVPVNLRQRLTSRVVPLPVPSRSWRRAALLAAAAIIALAALFGLWRGPFQPATSLADYRDEMVSFIKVTPSLELETSELTRITDFLEKSGAPAQLKIPESLRKLDPVGCRTLRFRGHDVALICFKRGGGRVAHLLVVDRAAVRGVRPQPEYATQGEWATAAWSEAGRDYLLAVQGDQDTAKKFISDS